jgi:arginine deiminase
MKARITAEWDRLRSVVMHRPGIEMFFGLLEPYASLYERAFSRYGARIEHTRLEETLKHEFGVNVILLKEAILAAADSIPAVREQLVSAARESLLFCGDAREVSSALHEFERNIDSLDSGHFFNILLLNPGICRESGSRTREIQLNITERQPLSNLYFMRDPQAVTDRGIVLSRMAKPQRNRETRITRFLWETLDLAIVHETESPGTFEGGDFLSMKEFALIGTGDRTNRKGAEQLLGCCTEFDEIAFVRQPTHPLIPGDHPDPMIAMHLDTYFNVASSGVVVGSELLMKRAGVEIYHREGDTYRREKEKTTLHAFIRAKGFDIIDLTTLEQMAYAPNFLCIRDGTILAVEVDRTVKNVLATLTSRAETEPDRYGALLARAEKDYRLLKSEGQFFPHKKEIYCHDIDAYPVILQNLTGGYGAAHCMTCALERG